MEKTFPSGKLHNPEERLIFDYVHGIEQDTITNCPTGFFNEKMEIHREIYPYYISIYIFLNALHLIFMNLLLFPVEEFASSACDFPEFFLHSHHPQEATLFHCCRGSISFPPARVLPAFFLPPDLRLLGVPSYSFNFTSLMRLK